MATTRRPSPPKARVSVRRPAADAPVVEPTPTSPEPAAEPIPALYLARRAVDKAQGLPSANWIVLKDDAAMALDTGGEPDRDSLENLPSGTYEIVRTTCRTGPRSVGTCSVPVHVGLLSVTHEGKRPTVQFGPSSEASAVPMIERSALRSAVAAWCREQCGSPPMFDASWDG